MPHKVCPKCSKSLGVRTHKCDCGHEFIKKEIAAKVTPIITQDIPQESISAGVFGLQPIHTPGTGAWQTNKRKIVPYPCNSLAEIPEWMEKCQQYAEKVQTYYTHDAFKYMARTIWSGKELIEAFNLIEQTPVVPE